MPGLVPPVANEHEALLAYLDQQRQALRCAALGLTDQQARMTPTPSRLSIGGIVKHVAQTEGFWIDLMVGQYHNVSPEEGFKMYLAGLVMTEGETLHKLLDEYERVAERTDALAGNVEDPGQAVPVPKAPWFPEDVDAWSVRWVVLHLIEETARHAGHADIIREAIDGSSARSLMVAGASPADAS